MHKFWAVLKREYRKIVWTWTFIVTTLIAPLFLLGISLIPMLLFSLKGEPIRIALVERSGQISARLKENLSPEKQFERFKKAGEESLNRINITQEEQIKSTAQQMGGNFVFEEIRFDGENLEEIRRQMRERIRDNTLDSYLIIPENSAIPDAKFRFYSRNPSDVVTKEIFKSALDEAVRAERLAKADISAAKLSEVNQPIDFTITKVSQEGEENDSGMGFYVSFILAFVNYLALTLYGSVILGAVIEEKETRIAEVLFSSATPFQLMMGKIIGVGLAALTQLSIWLLSAGLLGGYLTVMAGAAGTPLPLPAISFTFFISFLIFFLLGFFSYATIYAIIGAMVTTSQEGQQYILPPILISLGAVYSVFPVIRDPNSTYSFWASIAPFISPIVMPVRIWIDTPPVWEILLSIVANVGLILLMIWLAAKIYRIGMLMYGKRATIPEVWRWLRQQ